MNMCVACKKNCGQFILECIFKNLVFPIDHINESLKLIITPFDA